TLTELESIVDPTAPNCAAISCFSPFPYGPCIDPMFGVTQVDTQLCVNTGADYWSAEALGVDFSNTSFGEAGFTGPDKLQVLPARAVRGDFQCVPSTCNAQAGDCGAVVDGCGGLLDCGDCPSPERCVPQPEGQHCYKP